MKKDIIILIMVLTTVFVAGIFLYFRNNLPAGTIPKDKEMISVGAICASVDN